MILLAVCLGPEHFTLFDASVGEGVMFFGKIELLVFVLTDHIKNKIIEPLNDLVHCVKTGINLVVDRAANKG